MKYRVERERRDHGYGNQWAVLDPQGNVIELWGTWSTAYLIARALAKISRPRHREEPR